MSRVLDQGPATESRSIDAGGDSPAITTASTATTAGTATTRRLWRLAGGLAIAHVVLVFAGVAFEKSPLLGDPPSKVASDLVTGPMAKTFAGGYVEVLGFMVFLIGALLLARLLRGSTDTSGWLSSCIGGSAVANVAVTVATGFAAGAAALYDGHHGAPLSTVTTVVDIRNFAYFLTGTIVGVFTLSVAFAVRVTGLLPRWVFYTGLVSGVLSIATVPGARVGLIDVASLLWFAWFVALGVAAMRRAGAREELPAADAAAAL